jgi:hypothetical protein
MSKVRLKPVPKRCARLDPLLINKTIVTKEGFLVGRVLSVGEKGITITPVAVMLAGNMGISVGTHHHISTERLEANQYFVEESGGSNPIDLIEYLREAEQTQVVFDPNLAFGNESKHLVFLKWPDLTKRPEMWVLQSQWPPSGEEWDRRVLRLATPENTVQYLHASEVERGVWYVLTPNKDAARVGTNDLRNYVVLRKTRGAHPCS